MCYNRYKAVRREFELRPVIFFNVIISILFLTIVIFQILLHRSLKKSLYNYRNTSFIAGIIFGFVMLVSLYNYLIECLINTKGMRIYYIFREFISFPKKFLTFAIPIFAVICILLSISNIVLIRHEGMRLRNVLGIFTGILFLGGTFANIYIEKYIEEYVLVENGPFDTPEWWVIHTYSQLFVVLVFCYMEVYFIATAIMAYLAAKQVPKYNKEYIIILGCSINKKGGLPPLLKARTDRAVRYAWEQEIDGGRRVKFVPSGGKGFDEVVSEGTAIENYLIEHGVEPDEIITERESRNTYENFLYSKRLIDEIDKDARICFATTNYHMYRSGLIAKRLGIDIEGIASKTKWYFWPNGLIREFVAILVMEWKLHVASIAALAIISTIMGLISYHVFEMYWL